MRSTTYDLSVISTRSPMSKGCLTKRKMHDPRTSCAVTEKMKLMDSKEVAPAAMTVPKPLVTKETAKNLAREI